MSMNGAVEKSSQRRSHEVAVLTYSPNMQRAKRLASLLDERM